MSNIDHIIFFLFLFIVFYFITRLPQKYINENFWKIAIFPIIGYSFILGCRYGWGNDYFWYKFRIENPYAYDDEEIGFRLINVFLNYIGFNYVATFVVYSFIFIFLGFIFIKDYKYNKYMIALFLPATLILETFTIRQSLSTSFIFLALHFIYNKKYIHTFISISIVFFVHGGNITVLLPLLISLLISKYLTKEPISWKITIPIYILFSLFSKQFEQYAFSIINDVTSSISLDNRFQSYIDNSDFWFSSEGSEDKYKQSTLTLTLSMLFHISIIYLCNKMIIKKNDGTYHVVFIYNCIVISLLLLRLFFTYEILRRIAETIFQFYFVPLGYALFIYHNTKIKLTNIESLFCRLSISCIYTYIILFFGRFILQSPTYKFIWNI